jgi:hypothetical protein
VANILQIIEQEVATVTAILPLIDAVIAQIPTVVPPVVQTPPVSFKVSGHVYSFVGVFTKVS